MNKTIANKEYLTEAGLYPFLEKVFGAENIQRQHRLANRKIVDYFVENCNLAIEFDGYKHYQSEKTVQRDIDTHVFLRNEGIHCIHIPYWLQHSVVAMIYFGEHDASLLPKYPLGFIDKDCVHPIDFSFSGWQRFVYEVTSLETPFREDIRETMTDKENSIFDLFFRKINQVEMVHQYKQIGWFE